MVYVIMVSILDSPGQAAIRPGPVGIIYLLLTGAHEAIFFPALRSRHHPVCRESELCPSRILLCPAQWGLWAGPTAEEKDYGSDFSLLSADTETGYAVMGALGYRVSPHVRAEGEISWHHNDVDGVKFFLLHV